MLAQGRSVAIQTIPLLCRCDPDKIKQVIYNLFHNAVQHTDSTTGQITVSANKTKDQVVLLVADNGAGIPKGISPSVRALLPYRRIPDQTVWWCGSWIVHYPIHHFRAWGADERDSKVNQGTVSCRVAGHQSQPVILPCTVRSHTRRSVGNFSFQQ